MDEHVPDPHHTATGEWVCWFGWTRDGPRKVCGRPLMGSYMRPVVPWRHKPVPAPPADPTVLPGGATTE